MSERNETQVKQKERLRPGMRVVASDGQLLGTVKEVSPSFFKVDVRMGRDYWLDSEHVSDVTGHDAILDFESARARSYKVDSPRLRDEYDPLGQGVAPALTEEDMLRQRAIMERELADQSQRLPELVRTPTGETPGQVVESAPGEGVEPLAMAEDAFEGHVGDVELGDGTPEGRDGGPTAPERRR